MSLEELMFLITPQRRINPVTDQALPKRGARRYEADFSVPGQVDPYAALLKRATEIASRGATTAGETLARPFTPNTWYGKQVRNPNGTWGPKIYEYSPFQKIGAGAAGTGALIGSGVALDNAMHPSAAPQVAVPIVTPEQQQAAIDSIRGRQEFEQGPIGSGRGAPSITMEDYLKDRAAAEIANVDVDRQTAIRTARGRPAPLPPVRPAELRPQAGGLSRFFSDPYAGKSARDLYAEANRMQSGGDEYGANLLIQRAGKMITKPEDLEGSGMATGGAAKPHKDAALHKALDIISHMLGHH